MKVIESYTEGKSTTVASSEDAVVVTSSYAAVIDGATPKTAFRYADGETPGHLAARMLVEAIRTLPDFASAQESVSRLTAALHQCNVSAANRPTASAVIYSATRREVWLIGDCQFATIGDDIESEACNNAKGARKTTKLSCNVVKNGKQIDRFLAEWRRDIIQSYLSRGIMTPEEIKENDPGRQIIQPLITQQASYQNQMGEFGFGVFDGEPIPEAYVKVYPIAETTHSLILASDGYPVLLPTLSGTEIKLQELLSEDPLCIGPLLGTKGLRPGNLSYDDRTYLRLEI